MPNFHRRRSESGRRGLGLGGAHARTRNRNCFPRSPELCVEVLSPGNTEAKIQERVALYFDAGAREVWLCAASGAMRFLTSATRVPVKSSQLCPEFPKQIESR